MESDGGEIPQKNREIPRKTPRHSRRKTKKPPVIPAKAGIHYRRLILEFPRKFFHKKRRERGELSVKMDSRFRGNDGGEGGILSARIGRRGGARMESDGGEIPQKIPSFPPKNEFFLAPDICRGRNKPQQFTAAKPGIFRER